MKNRSPITVVTFAAILLLASSLAQTVHAASGSFNRIAIVLDASNTFRAKRDVALEKANDLLAQIEAQRARKWEVKDQVVVISLDSMPEVLWSGPANELATNRAYIVERFAARQDYVGCTDVAEGLRLAAKQLNRDPQPEYKYAFVFSDLIHEPPTDSPNRCAPAQAVLSPAFDWGAFRDINTTVLWIPANQKFAWKKAVRDAGLEETFQLYSESDSRAVQIAAPKKAVHLMSEAERSAGREKITGFVVSFAKIVGIAVAVLLCLCVLIPAAGARRRGNRR